jgi:hypothetical protein
VEWGEDESEGWVPDLQRRNIYPSFSMGNILFPTKVISVNLFLHENYEYRCFMPHTHVYQELSAPKARKRTFSFAWLYLHIL